MGIVSLATRVSAILHGLLTALFLAVSPVSASAEETIKLTVPASGTEIVSQRYPAPGAWLVLWFTGQYGRIEEEHKAAAFLAAHGLETWVTDFYAPYFLPLLPSSARQVPEKDLSDWLEAVHERNPGRRIILAAPGHLAGLALRAEQAWASRFEPADDKGEGAPGHPIAGALMLFPLLYKDLEPGQAPDYDTVVDHSRLDTVIIQPKSSAGYWWRDRLKERFEAAGSHVWLNVLNGLRDGFYRRGDASAQEMEAGNRLGDIMLEAMKPLLEQVKSMKGDQP